MTSQHGGFEASELRAILGGPPESDAENEQGRLQFLSEADSVVPLPTGQTDGEAKPGEPKPERLVDVRADAIAKKFSGKLNKMKRGLAEKIPKAMNKAIKGKAPEWQLDAEDSEMLTESVENCFEVLDIDFQIKPLSYTLTNPLFVLLLPLLVLVLIFLPKAIDLRQAKLAAEAIQTQEAPSDSETILSPN